MDINSAEYWCWLHDRWGYHSLRTRLQKVLTDTKSEQDLVRRVTNFFSNYPSEYACVLAGRDQLIAIVDHMRSVPLFYTATSEKIIVCDRAERLFTYREPVLKKSELRKFILSGIVPGNQTLLEGIYQIPTGEYIRWTGENIQSDCYYHFWREEPREDSFENLARMYKSRFLQVMEECIHAYREKKIILLLSGGMDSRHILWALYELAPDSENIHLCTYGRPYRRDAEWGRLVAETTPFNWIFIPQKFFDWRKIYQSNTIRTYFNQNHNFTNLPYYQEFYALKYLQEKEIFPANCIFINGDSGGLLSGSHLSSFPEPEHKGEGEFVPFLNRKKFNLWSQENLGRKETEEIYETVRRELRKAPDHHRYLANIYDWWEWKERTSKFLMTAKYQIAHFNHRLFHPFWDKRIAGFFANLPLSQRIGQRFYHEAYRKFAGELDPALVDVPVTKPGKAIWTKKFRRAAEFASDPKWGRYDVNDIANARTAARYLVNSKSFGGLPGINSMNAGVLLWKLIQEYPVTGDE